jgi:hypothetical protein
VKTETQPKLTAGDVLVWLAMFAVAELDRNWVWLPVDLRGESNRELREELKTFGFRFAKHGHPLSSGAIGTWAHHCDRPMPFKRRGSSQSDSAEPNWNKLAQEAGLTVEQLKTALS